MNIAEYIYYSTFFVTIGLVALAFIKSLSAIQKRKDRFRCIVYFGISSILSGLISGAALFYGVLSLFDFLGHRVSVGHGEILIAAPVFNFGLGAVLAVIGTTLLRWLTPEA
ncbi:hypothetical protein GTP58_23860 [Duganella sp. CY15W]|uniref:YfhO family protein n=1 Tax=Duganella sp. CY15W TaxID=2692172 RepID=UPI00136E01A1|nr:YfhO family protein [Duganella sp. CY15W]MYM31378.1 hypothetical protein [Duganella sp. CY15W]